MTWYSPCSWTWPRESISDENGLADVAYVGFFMVGGAVVSAIVAMTVTAVVAAYVRCRASAAACTFDPQPLGIAIGAACTGLATALGALAGYMVATRRQPRPAAPPAPVASTVTTTSTTLQQPPAAEAATEVDSPVKPKPRRKP